MMMSKVFALLDGRAQVQSEDVAAALVPCLRHRIGLRPEEAVTGKEADALIAAVKKAVFR